jgi:peptidoglycan hydrolase-like protein with peptidoglycan-binding domain
MRDPTVSAVQTELTQEGYYNGPVDGIFGPLTRDAVAKYQIAKHLEVTGSLSAQTLQSFGLPQATAS